jgi:hypothetical protein
LACYARFLFGNLTALEPTLAVGTEFSSLYLQSSTNPACSTNTLTA